MWSQLLDSLFPSFCEFCRCQLDQGRNLCPDCLDALPRLTPPFCDRCGEHFDGQIDNNFTCPNCHDIHFDFDFARAPLTLNEQSLHLIHQIKYQRQFFFARDLAPLLAELLRSDPALNHLQDALLVPVPLHPNRQRHRKRNQAEEIARALASHCDFPLLPALKRTRHTTTQTRLNRSQRLKNLKGAFAIRPRHLPRLRQATVILIDDVFTTGSTLQECAKTLRYDGKAAKIIALTLARG
ncbi:MAG: ComF family protein [Verrucomicrobiales bacterium]